MIKAAMDIGFPPSGIINLHVRVPITGARRIPAKQYSMMGLTAKYLQMPPDELQEAVLNLRPDTPPGGLATFGVRASTNARAMAARNLDAAEDAAEMGNRWAGEYVNLARRVLNMPADD